MTTYLTGASNTFVREVAKAEGIGILLRPGNSYHLHVEDYACWAADNGQYTTGKAAPTDEEWFNWLTTATAELDKKSCLFATAPDVLKVIDGDDGKPIVIGDAQATIERSRPWLARIRELGLPAAMVAQDGVEELDIPWDELDVIFLGGSTEWKIGPGAARLVREAQRRGKTVHMGRVNSGKRFKLATEWGVDSVDGTFLAFGPVKNLPRLLSWVRERRPQLTPSSRFGRRDFTAVEPA